jgi:hypothetical protein
MGSKKCINLENMQKNKNKNKSSSLCAFEIVH